MLIRRLTLQNLLSFGPEAVSLEMRPLNVLIGTNGSGKSNVLSALSLLQKAPRSVLDPIRAGGGIQDWLWQSRQDSTGMVEVEVNGVNESRLIHSLSFGRVDNRSGLVGEVIRGDRELYRYIHGRAGIEINGELRTGAVEAVETSALQIFRDPFHYPELAGLAQEYERIRLYRDWVYGKSTPLRSPQRADLSNAFPQEDALNIALVVSKLSRDGMKPRLIEALQLMIPEVRDFIVDVEGGSVQLFLTEREFSVPASRLSDGTCRFLLLATILCHPNPPPLIGIEEPELGMHPDVLPRLARMLIDASSRTQLVVTTHSDILVDALSETPESVVVCEKDQTGTKLRRLEPGQLDPWLEKYRLGNLWLSGHLGGTIT